MDRAQFMEQLKKLLADIPKDERDEAIEYYENYFEDAGTENEASVIRELGSPGKVAAIIKADLKECNDDYAEYTERGYEDSRMKEEAQVPQERKAKEERSKEQRRAERAERGYHAGKTMNRTKVILILILLVFLSPFLTGIASGAVGVLITIVFLPFLLVFGTGVLSLGLIAGALGMGGLGITLFSTSAAAAVMTIGIACVLLALGMVLALGLGWLLIRILPKVLRKVTDVFHNLLHRMKGEV